jgi:hypothetical protein
VTPAASALRAATVILMSHHRALAPFAELDAANGTLAVGYRAAVTDGRQPPFALSDSAAHGSPIGHDAGGISDGHAAAASGLAGSVSSGEAHANDAVGWSNTGFDDTGSIVKVGVAPAIFCIGTCLGRGSRQRTKSLPSLTGCDLKRRRRQAGGIIKLNGPRVLQSQAASHFHPFHIVMNGFRGMPAGARGPRA